MSRLAWTALLLATVTLAPIVGAGRSLDIFFIDVEGGQSTLVVTPDGESLLIDAGYGQRGGRDQDRVMAAVADAGIDRIDYLIATHFHNDHVGGIPDLAARIPIGTFIDYGEPLGTDRMANNGFRNYEPVRAAQQHIVARPGERLPIRGVDVDVISAGGAILETALAGAGTANPACTNVEDHVEDGTENYRSVGVLIRFGAFRFLDLGDLSGNTLTGLACPNDMVGRVSAYLIAHHGDYDSNIPALYAALAPQVAIMNNGLRKGGHPEAFRTLRRQAATTDLWQLHWSSNQGADNVDDDFIANVDDGATGFWLRLTASADGSFRLVNGRTGFMRAYRTSAQQRGGSSTAAASPHASPARRGR